MDIVEYYTEISKKEMMNVKEVKDFKDDLDSEITKVSNLKFNSSFISKLIHPVKTIKNNKKYKKLNKVKSNFDLFVDSDVLQYVVEESGDLADDLGYAAKYYKPKAAVEYVRSLKKSIR